MEQSVVTNDILIKTLCVMQQGLAQWLASHSYGPIVSLEVRFPVGERFFFVGKLS